MKNVILEAKAWADEEIEKTGSPPKPLHDLARSTAIRLAKELNAEKEIVELGIELMDIKLGDSLKNKELEKHVENSANAAEQFLSKRNVSEESKKKVLSCILEHHNTSEFSSKESEICANEDCYKFLTVKGFILFVAELQKREMSYEQAVKYAVDKMNEKKKILTLECSKQELEPQIKIIEEIERIK